MRKLLWFTLGFSAACLASVYLLPEAWLLRAAGFGAVLFVGIPGFRLLRRKHEASLRTRQVPRRVFCAALGLGFGLLWCWGYGAAVLTPARASAGERQTLTAELCGYPQPSWYGHWADAWAELPGGRVRTRFYLYGELPELAPGDRIAGSFSLERADLDRDGEQYLALQAAGVLLTASGSPEQFISGGDPLRYFPVRLSRRVFQRLGALIPLDAAALPQAMLTGNRSGLSEAARVWLSDAGASHIIAVSGLHVSMLLGILMLLAGQGRQAAILGLPLLGLYTLMTGASPSVIRASVMLGLTLLAPLFREEKDPPSSLALAGLLLLLQNPWCIANLSFQLSFAAVAGLLLVAQPLQNWFLTLPRVKKLLLWTGPAHWGLRSGSFLSGLLRRLIRGVSTGVAASIGAQLFSLPIAALAFGSIPVYGVLTNLLVLPLASVCLGGALLVLALGTLSGVLGSWAGELLALPVRAILGICRLVSRLPGRLLYLDAYGAAFLGVLLLCLLLTLALREGRYHRPLLSVLAALLVLTGLQGLEARSVDFTMAALDLGQGQCVCLVTETLTVMTDCGGSGGPAAGRLAAAWLRRRGAERLDALILTHYDSDHMNGVETLLSLIPVGTVYLPDVAFDPENRALVEAAARAAGAELRYVTADLLLPYSLGEVQIMAPVSDRNDNAACISVLYSAAEYDMLITGDLDSAAEYRLLERESLPRAECYVAGHHGSSASSSQALLEAISPETVFISVGRNSYGLPSAEALDRLEACGAAVYRTDESGNLVITGR